MNHATSPKAIDISQIKMLYKSLLYPIFGKQLRIDDSEKSSRCTTIILDNTQGDFYLSLYGIDCVHLYWCNECFLFDKHRNGLVSSDTHGEIVFEHSIDILQLPYMVVDLILHLKDCSYVDKTETVRGKIPSGYDHIKDYIVTAKTNEPKKATYRLGNITIKYVCQKA